MNRATIVRGIQLIVGITLATFTYLTYDSIIRQKANLADGFAHFRTHFDGGHFPITFADGSQGDIPGGGRLIRINRR